MEKRTPISRRPKMQIGRKKERKKERKEGRKRRFDRG
jgi:hypothetical protein